MDIELHETIDAILNTEKEIAWCQKCLNEARSFLAVVPGEKEYYEKANELASKVLKEEERLKKELTS
jgi:hypothetical protein